LAGWVKSNNVERGFDITVQSQALSDEVVEEFNEIVGAVCRLRPMLIDAKVLESEWSDLEKLPEEIVGKLEKDSSAAILNMGPGHIAIHAQ